MKDKKRRQEFFSTYDHTGIEAHLENMAARGWMLEEKSQFGWIYRRIEPRKLHFAVTYYPRADDFDPEPSDAQKTFNDFCQHSGWMLAASFNKMQIFYNERENPIPIETDPVTQVNTIHKAMKKSFLPYYGILIVCGLILSGIFYYMFSKDPIGILSSTSLLIWPFNGVMLIVISLVEIIGYLIWHRKAMELAEEGGFLATRSHRYLMQVISALEIIVAIYCIASDIFYASSLIRVILVVCVLYIILSILIVGGIKSFLKQKKVKAHINKIITLIACIVLPFLMNVIITMFLVNSVVSGEYKMYGHPSAERYEYEGVTLTAYHDILPLTVGDLTGNEDENYYSKRWDEQESLLICQYTGEQDVRMDSDEDMPFLKYTITKVKMPAIYDICFNQIFDDYDDENDEDIPEGWKRRLVETDSEPWGANAVYQVYTGDKAEGTYLICWDDYIVEIDAGWELTQEQMVIIDEKLNGI